MNVLVLTDLEGISGVDSIDDIFEEETYGYTVRTVKQQIEVYADVLL
jgi:hypothetical protein